jgi:hypothetical protein
MMVRIDPLLHVHSPFAFARHILRERTSRQKKVVPVYLKHHELCALQIFAFVQLSSPSLLASY